MVIKKANPDRLFAQLNIAFPSSKSNPQWQLINNIIACIGELFENVNSITGGSGGGSSTVINTIQQSIFMSPIGDDSGNDDTFDLLSGPAGLSDGGTGAPNNIQSYTPTLTNVANLDASTAFACQYLRIGNVVIVSGKVNINPTAALSTQLGISLPVPSNIGAAEDCSGSASCPTIAGQSAAILGDIVNDRAQMEWIAVDLTNQPMYFIFAYRII